MQVMPESSIRYKPIMKKSVIVGLILGILSACAPVSRKEKPIISVSILPYKYFVERIAGDQFEVHVITPPGASPETYEPTPRQIKTLSESVIFIANGNLVFEDHLVSKTGENFTFRLINMSHGIELIAGETVEHGNHVHLHGIDPHHWLSPREVVIQAKTILDAISSADPGNHELYQKNYKLLLSDIEKLDKHIRTLIADSKLKTFLIYHPAFAYFAREYGLKQVALEMDGKEPSGAHMKAIIDLANHEGLQTILVQNQFNKAAAEAVAKEISGNIELLDPLPEDWLTNMYVIAHAIQKALNP